MIKKIACLLAVVGALSGCATTYTYEGQKYNSKEKFQQAVDSKVSGALSVITPLSTPLTQKKLMFGIFSEATGFSELVRRHSVLNGSQPNAQYTEMYENLSKSVYKNGKVFFDAIQKKNIYQSTQLIEMQSMTGALAASANTDALYYVEPAAGSGQWFYTSDKQGKQIFAFDRSNPTMEGKLQAFIEAVQAQAIRD